MILIVPPQQVHSLWPGFFQCPELVDFVIVRSGVGLVLDSPQDCQVVQRSAKGTARICVRGRFGDAVRKADAVQYRFGTNGRSGEWQKLDAKIDGTRFGATIDIAVGGRYRLGSRASAGGRTVAEATVERVLVSRLGKPVIAAGGIMDGAGIAAVIILAAQLGTAFVACPESSAEAGQWAALLGPPAEHTVMTCVVSGRLARCLANRFTALCEGDERDTIPDYPISHDAGKALHFAAKAVGGVRFWRPVGRARPSLVPFWRPN